MDLICPSCALCTSIPDDRLPPEGARARCHACGQTSMYYRGGLVADDPTPPRGLDVTVADYAFDPGATAGAEAGAGAGAEGGAELDADMTPPQGMIASVQHEGPRPGEALHRLASLPAIALKTPLRTPVQEPEHARAAGPEKSIGWQIRTAAGDQGPLPVDALRPLIRDGKLLPDDLACPPGGDAWLRAGDLAELKRWFSLQKGTPAGTAASTARDFAPCSRHPAIRGRWMCQGCGDLSCDQCVISAEVMRVNVKQCPACRKACTELVPTKKIVPFWEDLADIARYPLKGNGWIALLVFPVIGLFYGMARFNAGAGFVRISVVGYGTSLFIFLIILSYHLYVIRQTTSGGRSLPNLSKVEDWKTELIWPAFKAFVVSFLLFLPSTYAGFGVGAAQLELGMARGLHEAIAQDKAEARERESNPDWKPAETDEDAPDENAQALEEALASMGAGDFQEVGDAMGQAFGSWDRREERDYDAELREADAAIQQAKSRVAARQAVRALLVILALGVWPMILILIALFNTIVPAFQPQVMLKLVREIPREYAWCTAITAACWLGIWLLNLPFRNVAVLHNYLVSPATFYLSFIAFHVMGRTAEMAERQVDWH